MIRFHTIGRSMIRAKFCESGSLAIGVNPLVFLPEELKTVCSCRDMTYLPKKFNPKEIPLDKTFFNGTNVQLYNGKWSAKSDWLIDPYSVVQPGRTNFYASSAFSTSCIFTSCIYKGTVNLSRVYIRMLKCVDFTFMKDSCHTEDSIEANHFDNSGKMIEITAGYKGNLNN